MMDASEVENLDEGEIPSFVYGQWGFVEAPQLRRLIDELGEKNGRRCCDQVT